MNPAPPPAPTAALGDADIERLQTLLEGVPPPLEPLDVSALDGYLCGVLLQPRPVPAAQWLRWVTDVEGRPVPASAALEELQALVQRRHAELDRAIARRDWFDPWVFPPDDETTDTEDADPATAVQAAMLPWVAGFAAAMEAFPGLVDHPSPELIEPLALLYLHFDPEDLEDADALLAVIESIEPPADLAEAVQDAVRALMLMADVTRPRPAPAAAGRRPNAGRPARRPGAQQKGRSTRQSPGRGGR
jgi:uncharacterized protein